MARKAEPPRRQGIAGQPEALLVAQLRALPPNLVECLLQLVAPTDGGELPHLLVAQARVALTRHEAFRSNRATFHPSKRNGRWSCPYKKAASLEAAPKRFVSGDGPEFVLLLEDMQPAQQGDQLAGCDPGLARAAVVQLVGLHGPTWCDDSLKEAAWLSLGDPAEVNVMLGMFYRGVLGDFVDRYRDGLSPQETALLEHVGNATTLPFSPPPTETFCIVHQDYRLDNLLIDDRRTPPAITAVDWQSPALGGPLTDVAYFLGASLRPEDRRAAEVDIVRAYHDALRAFGITDFGWSECWEEYRRASLHGLVVAVLAAMGAERTERGDELIAAMVHRHSAHAFDAAAVEFLD